MIITVDREHILRMFTVNSEKSELMFKTHLKLDSKEDRVSCLHFFTRAKSLIVMTEMG